MEQPDRPIFFNLGISLFSEAYKKIAVGSFIFA